MQNKVIMGLISTLLALVGYKASAGDHPYESVDVTKFEEVIADSAVFRLDVRTAEEYADGHIAGAVNIDVLAPEFEQKAVTAIPKGKTVALYCRSGRRSKKAADILRAKGYQVVELDNGFTSWTNANRPIER